MQTSPLTRGLVAAVALGSLTLAACGSDASNADPTVAPTAAASETTAAADEPATTNAPAVPADIANGAATITVTVGTDDFETSGGTRVVSVPKGTDVTVAITDATTDQEYHLHGYDLEVAAKKGETGKIQFVADQTGQFDVESHNTETTLLVLVVV
jgi:hypothetical protein